MTGIWLLGYLGLGVGQQCAHWPGMRSIKSESVSLTLIHVSFTKPATTRQTLFVLTKILQVMVTLAGLRILASFSLP